MTRALVLVLLLCGATMRAEAPDVPTPLTGEQRLVLQNRILARDLAQERLDAVVREYSVAGYDLTASGDYVKHAEPTAASK